MARATWNLVAALRETATRLQAQDAEYRWSHFAHCNCGHLAQTLTGLPPGQIYEAAFRKSGDWGEQAAAFEWPDYGDRPALDEGAFEPENIGACPTTGSPMDVVLTTMAQVGLDAEDVRHLERLSDPQVRKRLGTNTEAYAHNRREHVVAYLLAWADALETELERAGQEYPVYAAAAE